MKIISGAQTGVDRAALDAAIELGLPYGGWVPKGRLAEDGRIAPHYELQESDSPEYPVRTELNVKESDATLILCRGPITGGTEFTHFLCLKHRKPVAAVTLEETSPEDAAKIVLDFLRRQDPKVLNVAGPRESKTPGIYQEAKEILKLAFSKWNK